MRFEMLDKRRETRDKRQETKNKKMKRYQVTINQNWSEEVMVSANSKAEARKKAWEKYKPKKANFSFEVESEDEY